MRIGFTEIIVIIVAVLLLIDPKTLKGILKKIKSLTSKIEKNGMKEDIREMSGSLKEFVEPIVDVRNDIQNLVDIRSYCESEQPSGETPDMEKDSRNQTDVSKAQTELHDLSVSGLSATESPAAGRDRNDTDTKNSETESAPAILTEHEMDVIEQFHPLRQDLFHTELAELPRLTVWDMEEAVLPVAVNSGQMFFYPEAESVLPKPDPENTLQNTWIRNMNFVNRKIESLEEVINQMINIKEINIAYQIPEDKIREIVETVWKEKEETETKESGVYIETENLRQTVRTIMDEEYRERKDAETPYTPEFVSIPILRQTEPDRMTEHPEIRRVSMVVFGGDDDFEENDDYF